MIYSQLPVKKGFFFVRIFRFSATEKDSLQKGREAIGIPGLPGMIPINKEVPLVMRVKVTLRCNECKQRNYNTMKNKKNTPDKLELNKYCPFCKKHTVHTETK